MNPFHLEGKYGNDLLDFGEHAIKGQSQIEKRDNVPYTPMYERFVNKRIDFGKQYNSFYEIRLKEMRPLLVDKAKKKWGNNVKILTEVRELQPHQDCVIIGTIYKDLSLFKSILNEKVASAFNPQLIGTQFLPKSSLHGPLSQENDPIILEDSTTRVTLKNYPYPVTTGVVASIHGLMDDNGDFVVSDTCYLHDTVESLPLSPSPSAPKDPYLLCVSGLSITHSISTKAHLLFEFIASQIGFVEDIKLASHIVRVVLLGNSTNLPREPFQRIRQDTKELNRVMSCASNLDHLLSQILPNTHVTLVPGATDPGSMLIPQQPLHPSLFRCATTYSSLECSTNPYQAVINNKLVLMTSGQNIQDILRQVAPPISVLDAMALTLEWGLLFPTNPNTCPGIPYDTTDPFIIPKLPDVYVVGNQSELQIEKRRIGDKEVVLIAVPSFSNTGTICMINLNTLSVESMEFNVDSIEEGGMVVEEEKEEDDIVINEDIANEDADSCVCYGKQTNKDAYKLT